MRSLLYSLVLLVLLGPPFARPVRAADSPPAEALADPAERTLAERRSWATRVRELRAEQRADLAQRVADLRALPAGPAHAEAQRALEDAKREWKRRMLAAQLERADAAGQGTHAARLRERITELESLTARAQAPVRRGGAR